MNHSHHSIQAEEIAPSPLAFLRHLFFGHPLKTAAMAHERLNVFWGLPVLAVDALSSVAYATEEILIALSVAGAAALSFSVPIAFIIVLLLFSLITSYIQTVHAYPQGGGAYIVAKHHLGTLPALIAAASLLIDYVLTVAVSVTAGMRALASAFPSLQGNSVSFSIIGILLLAWINLRGMRESSRLIALPVYVFIILMFALGFYGLLSRPSLEIQTISSLPFSAYTDSLLLPVVLRAFAGGCTAMTGIESVANAGSSLAKPHDVIAQRILVILGIVLGTLFLSLTLTANALHLQPKAAESLLSQMTRLLWGEGLTYWVVQCLTALILLLAANTAFASSPRLSAILAKDGWFPKQLAAVGDRLVYSNGITALAFLAILFIILFNGNTHHLIPLYAVGVFTAFTLSQAGMVCYWLKHPSPGEESTSHPAFTPRLSKRYGRGLISAIGALMTGLALLITLEAKFFEGAFLIVIAVPLCIVLCKWIKHHYLATNQQLAIKDIVLPSRNFAYSAQHTIIVPISRLHRASLEALAFAREMSREVIALIVDIDHGSVHSSQREIEALGWDIKVEVLPSPYRSIIQPIIEYVHTIDQQNKKLAIIVLPEFVPAHWWHRFLHNRTSIGIMKALARNEHIPGQARIIINVPFYLAR